MLWADARISHNGRLGNVTARRFIRAFGLRKPGQVSSVPPQEPPQNDGRTTGYESGGQGRIASGAPLFQELSGRTLGAGTGCTELEHAGCAANEFANLVFDTQ